jgi:hypothetical protein
VTGAALQGGSGGTPLQVAGSAQASPSSGGAAQLTTSSPQQPALNPQNFVDPTQNAPVVNTSVDPNAAASDAQAAQAGQLRQQITDLANQIKGIYNGRYGAVDNSASEQVGKLDDRFGKESGALEQQIGQQNEDTGAAFAGNGTYDSSYRGNAQDRISQAGNQQVGALGDELKNNIATIAQWVQQQKAGFDAGKNSMDTIVSSLADETNPTNLINLRNQVDAQIATLQGQSADNNTESQNMSSLEQVAPSTPRTQQLQVTLSSILGGNASPTTKAALGGQLIASADIPAADQSKLLQAFHADLAAAGSSNQQQQPTVS